MAITGSEGSASTNTAAVAAPVTIGVVVAVVLSAFVLYSMRQRRMRSMKKEKGVTSPGTATLEDGAAAELSEPSAPPTPTLGLPSPMPASARGTVYEAQFRSLARLSKGYNSQGAPSGTPLADAAAALTGPALAQPQSPPASAPAPLAAPLATAATAAAAAAAA